MKVERERKISQISSLYLAMVPNAVSPAFSGDVVFTPHHEENKPIIACIAPEPVDADL
jgi:hypothetical protein|tara:strand:+ start:69 stop:242 length:174 start_codon:yes stop_codon:yes gene_type:complete